MNKIAIVAGAAAIAVLAGCKNPNYKYSKHSYNPDGGDVTNVDTTPADEPLTNPDVRPAVEPVEFTTEERHCTCPAGTVHTMPCACGASDCTCKVTTREVKPLPPPPPPTTKEISALPGAPASGNETSAVATAPVATGAETTPYIIQRGDTLALISKRYNIKLDSLRRANPQIKNDVVVLGRTITLPVKVDVGTQTVPAGAFPPAPPKPEYKPYTGDTKTYVVQNGDYLGKIAHANKLSIRQLKELNGLSSDVIRVGQKLKVPATGAAPAVAEKPVEKKVEPKPAKVEPPKTPKIEPPVVVVQPEDVSADLAIPGDTSVETAADDASTFTITVEPGDDITSISLTYSVDPAVIRDLNGMSEDDQVVQGQTLKLPAEVK